ncbi:hypothetical protein ACFOPN_02335 [Xanthomonas hyacinthi]|uniref:hypothetical protein n=2 Tax=Xanthomonas hyacinthi TaxID=56455 RepID=UPI00360FB215
MGSELFGDKVGLYMGDLEFVQKDIDIPGNNTLSVSISRRFVVNSSNLITSRPFKDWELDVPHIHGVFAINSSPNNSGWEPTRCSQFFAPLGVSASEGVSYPSEILWNGTYVYLPGVGDQEILKATPAALPTPQDGTAYPLSTKDASIFSCLSSLAGSSSGTGEGFTMIRPDGTKYRFDHLVTRYASSLLDSYGKPVRRNEIWILPTSVTDRFGNTVTYTWSGWQLISIVASDGRRIDITGLPITSVTDGTRTWRYEYSNSSTPALIKVSLPDNSVWQYALSQLYGEQSVIDGAGACNSGGSNAQYGNTSGRKGTMIHPSGALGEFTVVAAKHGRSWVPAECKNLYANTPTYEVQPQVLYNYRILQKKLTGPGLPTQGEVWSYVYGPPNHCWAPSQVYPGFLGAPNIVCNANSPVTKEVLVTSPDSSVTRYTFGNRYNQTEGRMLRVDFNWNGTSAGRTVQYAYHSPKAGPYSESFGYSIQPRGDSYLSNANMPEESVVTEEQGVLFKSLVNSFDNFARPTSVTKSSSPRP